MSRRTPMKRTNLNYFSILVACLASRKSLRTNYERWDGDLGAKQLRSSLASVAEES